jgi:hypothetical protein
MIFSGGQGLARDRPLAQRPWLRPVCARASRYRHGRPGAVCRLRERRGPPRAAEIQRASRGADAPRTWDGAQPSQKSVTPNQGNRGNRGSASVCKALRPSPTGGPGGDLGQSARPGGGSRVPLGPPLSGVVPRPCPARKSPCSPCYPSGRATCGTRHVATPPGPDLILMLSVLLLGSMMDGGALDADRWRAWWLPMSAAPKRARLRHAAFRIPSVRVWRSGACVALGPSSGRSRSSPLWRNPD